MAIPVPHTFTAGDDATSTVMQTLTDSSLYLLGTATSTSQKRPLVAVRTAVTQSIATSGTWQAVNFELEDVDYDNMHSTSTNTDRVTCNTAGWYEVGGVVQFVANSTGRRGIRFAVNGTAVPSSSAVIPATASGTCSPPAPSMIVYLAVNDILRLEVLQESTAALNINSAAMSAQWVSN